MRVSRTEGLGNRADIKVVREVIAFAVETQDWHMKGADVLKPVGKAMRG